jgi:hypothetical protein
MAKKEAFVGIRISKKLKKLLKKKATEEDTSLSNFINEKLLEIYKQDSDFKNENELVVDKLDKIIDLLELISKKG